MTEKNLTHINEYFITKERYKELEQNGQIELYSKYHITNNFPNPSEDDEGKVLSVDENSEYVLSDELLDKNQMWLQADDLVGLIDNENLGYIIWEDENEGVHKRLVQVEDVKDNNVKVGTSFTFNSEEKENAVKILHLPINKKIDYLISTFHYFKKLKYVDTYGWDTSNIRGMQRLTYDNVPTLEYMDVNKWDTSKVTTFRRVFIAFAKAKELDVTNWDVSNCTDMYAMFWGCSELENIGDISNWDVSKVTTFYGMFRSCGKLTTIGDLSNWNVSNVADMSYMFSSCGKLTTIGDLSNWNVSNVTNMSNMFSSCGKLTTIGDLSNWDTSNVTNMSYMFYNCSSLTNLNVSSFDTSKVTNEYAMSYMFYGCSNLRYITLSKKFFNTICPIPFNNASYLGLNTDNKTSNGWLEQLVNVTPTLPTGTTKTIQLPSNLYNKSWAEPYINELTSKGYTITRS